MMYKTFAKKITLLSLLLIISAGAVIARQEIKSQTKGVVIAVIHVDVIPQYTQAATSLLNSYLRETLKDKDVKRCKIFQEIGRANHFTLVEEWIDQSAYDAHVGDKNTRQFRNDIQPMLGAPLDERLHTELE